ncbi:hypothetical protein A1A1_01770 [Planococcus antarcticus DSM 14505]|uniref:DUF3278 domain-containing protein n=1 Tax=Planococcus antarcticus DSM 14505 TaxID=1185653 RepID=A0AA87INQ9_9BACL|nr:hypothetical protein [Planococcus antarcticus]EIM08193.1 hypothetical protein A1A1_01770 [Planococcus antarcticus DSM 14505]
MEKTWIANLLPTDEYREKRFLYFVAESVFILGIMLSLYLSVDLFFVALDVPGNLLALFSLGFLSIYIVLRSTLTGIEFSQVATSKNFKAEKRSKVYGALRFWIISIIVYGLFKGIPSNLEEALDILGPSTLAAIFLFILSYLSLRKSYNKNKELLDD